MTFSIIDDAGQTSRFALDHYPDGTPGSFWRIADGCDLGTAPGEVQQFTSVDFDDDDAALGAALDLMEDLRILGVASMVLE